MTLNKERDGDDRDALAEQLRRAGLKVTPQRLAVLGCLSGDESHPTAQELFDRLETDHPNLSFATVYNTLSALTRVGLVSPLNASLGGATRFDPKVDFHHHAVCDVCGAVRDVSAEGSEREPQREVPGFRVDRVDRIYRGVCTTCQSTGAAPND